MIVADGMPTGPFRVRTLGGTSEAYVIGLASITATAAQGTAADPAQASANPGQLITLNGTALDLTTEVVFQMINEAGTRFDYTVRPSFLHTD